MELERCCLEGLSSKETQLRLVRCGVVLGVRTVARRMSEWRAAQHQNKNLVQLGIGMGLVHADIAAATATMQTAAPEWRKHAIAALHSSLDQFVDAPTSERFAAVVVQSYGLLISTNLQAFFEGTDA
jgi:hypothetical protein